MGVPKFYRWVSERYPCLSEVIKDYQIPEFDNLYLDMNGIIHVCSHPEDDNPHFRITEEKIFRDIFHYIEVLFRMIKPRKVFFMAVDGVAPRAKMNQQRGRRFRSAREAEDSVQKAIEKGEVLPTADRFDSNCITPGTEFMAKLHEQLKYFVVHKITTDKLWQGPKVFLSGHETPGEGEHKIMDFIRFYRSQPSYNPNTRHCLYGLDADLMMLGLASHEPHFSLLREEVRFGGRNDQKKRTTAPEETTFHLLHLSLFREYLDFEFGDLKSKIPFAYSLEAIIDDWVLMGYLVGNDFIPHLPNLHIHTDAMPMLWATYKKVLPTLDGYLNEGGKLNLPRFEVFMKVLAEFDYDTFSENISDERWLKSKSDIRSAPGRKASVHKRNASLTSEHVGIPTANEFIALQGVDDGAIAGDIEPDEDDEDEFQKMMMMGLDLKGLELEGDDDLTDLMAAEFREHKDNYYLNKLELHSTPEMLRSQAEGYVQALQWILFYYYSGCPSWSWYYPHHYAPYLSDIKNFGHLNITFELGKPFLPFEQLMAVLPPASRKLLPQPLQELMVTESSPVIDFYPQHFNSDLNGKRQAWEAVVLIPFIKEDRLLEAMQPALQKLSQSESDRNKHSGHLLYEFTREVQSAYQSPLPGVFPDISSHHCSIEELSPYAFTLPVEQIKTGLLPGAIHDVYYPGFPTFTHLRHTAKLKKCGVKVFQQLSRGDNMILTPIHEKLPELAVLAEEYIGKSIHVCWPHLTEAYIVGVADGENKFYVADKDAKPNLNKKPEVITWLHTNDEQKLWYKTALLLSEFAMSRQGIDIGETQVLLYGFPLTGQKYVYNKQGTITLEKQWSQIEYHYPLQTTVKELSVHAASFENFQSLADLYPKDCCVFMLGWPHYGCHGEVIEVDSKNEGRVRVTFSVVDEPDYARLVDQHYNNYQHNYMPGYVAAPQIGISSFLLSRITGTITVTQGSRANSKDQWANIGLSLKFNKTNQEVPGYTKKFPDDDQWYYSKALVQIMDNYVRKFPDLFRNLGHWQSEDVLYEDDMFGKGKGAKRMSEIRTYLKGLPCSSVTPVAFGTQIIEEDIVKRIEHVVTKVSKTAKRKRVKMQVKPHLLYRSLYAQMSIEPDPSVTFELFDRVVNVREGFTVPLGLRGTVTGIIQAVKREDVIYEVLFDEDFLGGLTIRSPSCRSYRLPATAIINLSHGVRKHPDYQGATSHNNNNMFTGAQRGGRQVQYRQPQYTVMQRKESKDDHGNQSPNKQERAQPQSGSDQRAVQAKPQAEYDTFWSHLQRNSNQDSKQHSAPLSTTQASIAPLLPPGTKLGPKVPPLMPEQPEPRAIQPLMSQPVRPPPHMINSGSPNSVTSLDQAARLLHNLVVPNSKGLAKGTSSTIRGPAVNMTGAETGKKLDVKQLLKSEEKPVARSPGEEFCKYFSTQQLAEQIGRSSSDITAEEGTKAIQQMLKIKPQAAQPASQPHGMMAPQEAATHHHQERHTQERPHERSPYSTLERTGHPPQDWPNHAPIVSLAAPPNYMPQHTRPPPQYTIAPQGPPPPRGQPFFPHGQYTIVPYPQYFRPPPGLPPHPFHAGHGGPGAPPPLMGMPTYMNHPPPPFNHPSTQGNGNMVTLGLASEGYPLQGSKSASGLLGSAPGYMVSAPGHVGLAAGYVGQASGRTVSTSHNTGAESHVGHMGSPGIPRPSDVGQRITVEKLFSTTGATPVSAEDSVKASNSSSKTELFTLYRKLQMLPPHFDYEVTEEGRVKAIVVMPNGHQIIKGAACGNKDLACESVAKLALYQIQYELSQQKHAPTINEHVPGRRYEHQNFSDVRGSPQSDHKSGSAKMNPFVPLQVMRKNLSNSQGDSPEKDFSNRVTEPADPRMSHQESKEMEHTKVLDATKFSSPKDNSLNAGNKAAQTPKSDLQKQSKKHRPRLAAKFDMQ